jgi:HAD superfamily hydrolase (TIGR01490 family)
MKNYIAFFDLDHTILNSSSGRLFIRYAYRHKLLSIPAVAYGMYAAVMHRMGFLDTEKVVTRLSMKYRGWSEEQVERMNENFFDELVVPQIRNTIADEIEYHNKNGGLTAILSASTFYICRRVQRHLHMDDVLCTIPEVINGTLTGKLTGRYCYGKEKLDRALRFCKDRGLSMSASWYYADSMADLPVLENIGNPVCVQPDRSLRKIAAGRGWKIIDITR